LEKSPILRFPLTIRIPFPFTVKFVKVPRVRSPNITSVSLMIKLLGRKENERDPFTVIYPLIVISYPRILVWGDDHVGLQLVAVSQSPV